MRIWQERRAVPGHDQADGKSDKSPFRHIQKCADVMVPGDTCLVLSGTYEETVVPARSGNAELPITYRAAPGATGSSALFTRAAPTIWRHWFAS